MSISSSGRLLTAAAAPDQQQVIVAVPLLLLHAKDNFVEACGIIVTIQMALLFVLFVAVHFLYLLCLFCINLRPLMIHVRGVSDVHQEP